MYVALGLSAAASEIRTYAMDGRLVASWGRPLGVQPGQLKGAHGMSLDSDGNFYIAEVFGARVQKYRPSPGVNPKLLFRRFANNSF